MINKIRRMFVIAAAAFALAAPAAIPAMASAQDTGDDTSGDDLIKTSLCTGTNLGDKDTGCDADGSTTAVNTILRTVIQVFSIIVGVVAVVMIIVGGLKYITSGGDSSNVSGAKNTIIYALVGLVIVALAQFIVHYVLAKADVTT